MQDNPKMQEQEKPANTTDDETILQHLLYLLDTFEYSQVLDALLQKTQEEQGPFPLLLVTISRSISLLSRRDERERYLQLLNLLKDVAEASNRPQSLSFYHYWQGKLDQDEERLESAIFHFEEAIENLPNSDVRLDALHQLAGIHLHAGYFVKAEQLFQRLSAQAQEQDDAQAASYGYLGLGETALRKRNLAGARRWLQLARQYAERANDLRLVAHILTLMGIEYAHSEELSQAQEYYQELEKFLGENADRFAEEVHDRAWLSLKANRAMLAYRERHYDEALIYAQEALAKQEALTGIEALENLQVVGLIKFSQGDRSGLQHLLSAFRLAEKLRYQAEIALVGQNLGIAYARLGYYEPAHRICAAAIDALERMRRQVGDEISRLQYIEYYGSIYTAIVILCLLLTQLKRKFDYLRQALAYVERAKSRTLIEALGRTVDIVPPARLPSEFLHREAQLLDQLHALEAQLRTPLVEADLQQAQQSYAFVQSEIDDIWQQITKIAPEYAALRQGQPLSFEEVRSLLRT